MILLKTNKASLFSGLFYVYDLAESAMCELTNQQAYDYYKSLKSPSAKDYWLNFLKSRSNRGGKDAKGAQEQLDKIKSYK